MEMQGCVFLIKARSCSLIITVYLALMTWLASCAPTPATLTVREFWDKKPTEMVESPLIAAASHGNRKAVLAELDGGANVNDKDEDGSTALEWAALYGHTDVVRILLDRGGSASAKNNLNATPLHYAAFHGHTDVVRILLDAGADPGVRTSSDGLKPSEWAAKEGHTNIVRMLRKAEERYMMAKKPIPPVPKVAPVAKPHEVEFKPIYKKPTRIEKTVTLPKMGKYYAVVIGIGKYKDDRIPKLKYTTVDAESIYNILSDPQYGDFPKTQVKLLINEEATYSNIKSAIGTWLRRNTRKDDTVIIFFAGHGAPEDEKTYWVTYNANIDDLYGTTLSNDEIADMLDRVEAKKMIAFLDSCYSAATIHRTDKKRSIIIAKDPFQKFKGKGRVIITSSDGKEQSLEIDKFGHGVFTYHLLKALKGEADENKDGYVELDEVWDYVKYRVTDTARRYGSTQTPIIDGSYSAGIVLSKHAERLRELELDAEREKKQKELELKIARLTELYSKGELTDSQFDKAVRILESGEKNKLLEKFLSDKISLTTFKRVFK